MYYKSLQRRNENPTTVQQQPCFWQGPRCDTPCVVRFQCQMFFAERQRDTTTIWLRETCSMTEGLNTIYGLPPPRNSPVERTGWVGWVSYFVLRANVLRQFSLSLVSDGNYGLVCKGSLGSSLEIFKPVLFRADL